jgi:hypothetical protein
MYRLVLAILTTFTVIQVSAQNPAKPETGFVYKYEILGGVMLHSNGWGLSLDYSRHKTYLSRIIYGLDYVMIRHPKEFKIFNAIYDDAKGYYFGKLNSIFSIRPMIGHRRIVFQKLREKGVEVSVANKVGAALTFMKPVYLEILHSGGGSVGGNYLATERYNPEDHNVENIYGRSPWSKGLGDSKFTPGIVGRTGILFEFAPKGEAMSALELGLMAEAYLNKLDIMANDQNSRFHLNIYLSFVFGGKHL